jgi:hypothetical protein
MGEAIQNKKKTKQFLSLIPSLRADKISEAIRLTTLKIKPQ